MSLLDSDKAGQHIDRVSVNAAKQAGVDTQRLFTGGANLTTYDIPLDHLDFKYIESCKNEKELEKILKVLRSGKEGHYPELEETCEKRLKEIAPKSRILRKDCPAKTMKDLQHDEAKELAEDLKDWSSEMKSMEDAYRTKKTGAEDKLPPVRGSGETIATSKSTAEESKNKKNKSVKPRDYREWDKFDIDGELEKVEKEEPKKPSYTKPKKLEHVDETIPSEGMTPQETNRKAEMEKNKGNEYFASQEFDAAILYYSRSLSLVPSAPSYNNRALAYLKLEKWSHAVADCNRVLQLETENVKAFLRRGSAYKGMKDYEKAIGDFQGVLEVEPQNQRAKKLLEECEESHKMAEEERKSKGRRMVIEDVGGSDEEVEEIEAEPAPEVKKKGKKMVIEEVEDSDSENEDTPPPGGGEQNKLVNGDVHHTESSVAPTTNGISMETKVSGTSEMPKRTNPFDKESSENKDWALPDSDSGASTSNTEQEAPPNTAEEVHLEPKEAQVVVRPEQPLVAGPKIIAPMDLPADVQALKTEGNDLFKAGQYGEAIPKYSKALHKIHKDEHQFYNSSLLLSNRAACKSKTGDARGCIEDCGESLKLVPHSVKPLLRRAQAFEMIEKYRKAYVDYRHILLINPAAEMALQGSTRCSKALYNQDGVTWRDKLPDVPSVNPEDMFVLGTPDDAVSTPSPTTEEAKPVVKAPEPVVPEKTNEEKFLEVKNEGAAFVQKQNFQSAITAYSTCIELFPDRAVSYTNRALCYLRVNKALDALNDCTKALELEPGNVKAYFRRAQARKMMKFYKGSMEDLLNLLKIDSKNAAARKELDIVQKYYKEELMHQKKEQGGKPTDKKQTGGKKEESGKRKKLIIEEVDGSSDEEKKKTVPEKPAQKHSSNKKHETKAAPPSEGKQSKKEKRKGAKTPTAPVLSKKTPYEFMQAWNSLKKCEDTEQYAKLIQQVRPQELPKLISNKLESDMLTVLIKCVQEHILEKNSVLAYNILYHLSRVDRFKLLTMFVPDDDKAMLTNIFATLSSARTTYFSKRDVENLKDVYGF